MKPTLTILFIGWLLGLLWIVGGENLHGGQLTLSSPKPVLWQDSTNLVDWQDIACSQSLQIGTANGNLFIRGVQTNAVLSYQWPARTNGTAYNLYLGPASRTYTQVRQVGATNAVTVNVPAWPVTYAALTWRDGLDVESDFGGESACTNTGTILQITKL